MRIEFAGRAIPLQAGKTGFEQLFKLLAKQATLTALIKRVSPGSLVLEIGDTEFKLPLAAFAASTRKEAFIPGRIIKIERRGEKTLAFALPDSALESIVPEGETPIFGSLEEHLAELGIDRSEQAVFTARTLLENGFPLEKELVLALLPWAERGELAEALVLLKARFPLKRGLIEIVRRLPSGGAARRLLSHATDLPAALREALAAPSFANRAAWSGKVTRGEVFKVLCYLLAQERLLEALAVQAGRSELIFALPFLRADDLHACWVRIARDRDGAGTEQGEIPLCIELEIPTTALGIVGARLVVLGKNVTLSLQVAGEDHALWQRAAQELREDLATAGWRLRADA